MEEKQNQGRTLHIVPGRVNQPVVENIEDEKSMESAFFGMQYKQMLSCLDDYVKNCNPDGQNVTISVSPNNVFTFVGERGSGKTSCMISVSKLLTNGKLSCFRSYEYLSKAQFTSIDLIDPSYFDESHNIVAFVVATLYKAFKAKEESKESNICNRDHRKALIDAFVHTQRSIRCLLGTVGNEQDGYGSDDIDSLSDLSSAIALKVDIQRLVNAYLKFVGKDNGFLVLSIDDIDLNVSEADTMAEQIRKYLVSPNIVILLAAKLDQLATIKNLHYAERYESLLKKNLIDYAAIEKMTSQFLTKFAPHNQRVYMPTDEVFLNSGLEVNGDIWYGDNVTQVLPELIFNRTRFLFYNTKQTPSYIIPRNLRKLCQLIALLWSMKPYCDENQKTNKEAFKKYLFNTWIPDNLSQEDRARLNRLLSGWQNGQLNKIALDVLQDKYKYWIDLKKEEVISNLDNWDMKNEIKALFDDRNREFNLSVGDVMSLIEALEISFESFSDKCFFFIIKTIYSMALYEAYDIITEKQDHGEEWNKSTNAKRKNDNQTLLYDPFDDEKIERYHKLIGGRFFNYRLYPVLAKETIVGRAEQVARSDRMVNYTALNKLLNETIKQWRDYQNGKSQYVETPKDGLKYKVRLCEFFMLCCIRDINRRNAKSGKELDFYEESFRRVDSVYYNGDYTGRDWLYFDLGAFFFNITSMDNCYQRYKNIGKDFLELCYKDYENKENLSLYACFRKRALDYRKSHRNPHAWQSWASIRNAEILLDLNQYLRSKCKLRERDNQKHMARYFKVLSEYAIKTYDRNDTGSKLNINFNFASTISSLLSNDSISSLFDSIFSAFYTEEDIKSRFINIDDLVNGRRKSSNKKETVRKYLLHHENNGMDGFQSLVDEVISQYDERMTRDEVYEVGNRLNELIKNRYGDTQSNLENPIQPTESQTDSRDGSSES